MSFRVSNGIDGVFMFVFVTVMSQASFIPQTPLECECFNATAPDSCKNKRITCDPPEPDKQNYCFVVWSTDNHTKDVRVSMKGCFTNNAVCDQQECVDAESTVRKKHKFCCCSGNMCNVEHRWIPNTTERTEMTPPPPKQHHANFMLITVVCFAITMTIGIGVFFVYTKRQSRLFKEIPTNEPDVNGSSLTLNSPRAIHMIEEKAHGRFGSVWRAEYMDKEVAVKVFPMSNKNSWQTEQEIFKLPHMKHVNILEFIGSEKRNELEPPVFWLITSYHTLGSLCDYLKGNTVTWVQLLRIAESMARGLSHLHDELAATKTEGVKPAVAHRDFKSKNVLLKSDMTACIADFGLALIFEPGMKRKLHWRHITLCLFTIHLSKNKTHAQDGHPQECESPHMLFKKQQFQC